MIMLVVFVFGLIFGSFINALVWRIHTKRKWWGNERSMCTHCKHNLAAKDLVPVLSWLALRGKCRYCKKPISVQYPAVELLTASLFALSCTYWPVALTLSGVLALITWLFTLVILVALLVYDLKWMLLPNKMVAALTASSIILAALLAVAGGDATFILEAVIGGMVFFGLFWGLFVASKGKWIGGGDVKIAFALGLIAGSLPKALLIIFLASVLGTLIVTPLLLSKKLKVHAKIPFGPFLIIATVVVFLFGQSLIDWYLQTFLYL